MQKHSRYMGVGDINNLIIKSLNEKKQLPIKKINQVSADTFLNVIPNFQFTEEVGTLDTEERKIFNYFLSEKISNANSLKQKIKILNNIFNKLPQKLSTQECLSYLIILKGFRTLLTKYGATTVGNIGEHYLAALFGGEVNANKDHVVDMYLNEFGRKQAYQIKIYSDSTRELEISTTYEDFFNSSPNASINFLFVSKIASEDKKVSGLQFRTFKLSKKLFMSRYRMADDYETVRSTSPARSIEKKSSISSKYDKKNQILFRYSNFRNSNDSTKKEIVIDLNYLKKRSEPIGGFNITDKSFNIYLSMIEQNIKDLLKDTANLINNVTSFCTSGNVQSGRDGIQNCQSISQNIKDSLSNNN